MADDNQIAKIIEQVTKGIDEKIQLEVSDKVTKPLSISSIETKTGKYRINEDSYDVYEKTFILNDLPIIKEQTKEYVISDEPLGFGLYFNVDSFVVSSGKGLSKEFFNFNYKITRFYINENYESCIAVECTNNVTENVFGKLHLQYCKFLGDIISFKVSVPSSIDKNSVNLEFPALKYNKKMAFSYITDDSYSIYQYIFSAINKRRVVKKFMNDNDNTLTYHYNMEGNSDAEKFVIDSYYPEFPLQCTDGAGIKKRYATSVSTWANKLKDQYIGQDVGYHYPWISEKEFKMFYDFGFTLCYHDLFGYTNETDTQEEFDLCLKNSVDMFKEYVNLVPKVMVEPNGDHKYLDFASNTELIQCITAQSGDTRIKKVYPFTSNFSLSKNDVTIERRFAYGSDLSSSNDYPQYAQDILDILDGFEKETDNNKIYWLIGSAHRSSHWEAVLFQRIHENFGDIGTDSLWFPTIDEFFEYWYITKNTAIKKEILSDGINFKMYVPSLPNFYFRDLSLMLEGIDTMEGISIQSDNNIFGTSYSINDGKLLVNLNFDKKLIERAEKYVTEFEKDNFGEYNYDNALYFVQQLKESVKESYQNRINNYAKPPFINELIINGGDTETKDKDITVVVIYEAVENGGQIPSHIMLSNNEDFSDGEWKPYQLINQWTLLDGFGQKTVYCKLKNIFGESDVNNKIINYEKPDLVFNGISINGNSEKTNKNNIEITFNYTGYPDYYWISEKADFSDAEKIAMPSEGNNTFNFTISEGYGIKTIYCKLDDGKSTLVKSATIEYVDESVAILNSIVINDGSGVTSNPVLQIHLNVENNITKYRIGTSQDLSSIEWIPYTSADVQYDTSVTEDGTITIYAQVMNGNNESDVKSNDITYFQEVVFDSLEISDGNTEHVGNTVDIKFVISKGSPTQYRLSESESEILNEAWISYEENAEIKYTFSNEGDKILYGQLSNPASTTEIKSALITIIKKPLTLLFANVPKPKKNVDGIGTVNAISLDNHATNYYDVDGNLIGTQVGKIQTL